MKNKKQTILIILISVLIILGITAVVLTTTINKTKANTETGTEDELASSRVVAKCEGCGVTYSGTYSCGSTCFSCGGTVHSYNASSSCGAVTCNCRKEDCIFFT